MRQHYRGFLPSGEEKLFFLKCYAVLRERFFSCRYSMRTQEYFKVFQGQMGCLRGKKIRAKPDKSLWNAA